jgi:hypothetical protein
VLAHSNLDRDVVDDAEDAEKGCALSLSLFFLGSCCLKILGTLMYFIFHTRVLKDAVTILTLVGETTLNLPPSEGEAKTTTNRNSSPVTEGQRVLIMIAEPLTGRTHQIRV